MIQVAIKLPTGQMWMTVGEVTVEGQVILTLNEREILWLVQNCCISPDSSQEKLKV